MGIVLGYIVLAGNVDVRAEHMVIRSSAVDRPLCGQRRKRMERSAE